MMVSAKKSRFQRISRIIITVFFIFCTLSLAATKIVYDSIFTRYDAQAEIPQALASIANARQVCRFSSGDNSLTGYYYDTADAKGLIVLVPGFHAGGDNYLWQIQELSACGWSIFTFDTTGTFRSGGDSQIGFSQAVLDLEAALQYLDENSRFGHEKLILMGHSRGAYAACCALSQAKDIAAVVSISGTNSAMEAIMQMSGPIGYGNYGFLWLYQLSLFGADALNSDAAEAISESSVPVLVIHGTKDTQIPTDTCSIISHKSQITSSNVEFLLCDAGHTDLLYDADGTANDALISQIHDFLIRSIEK